MKKFAIINLLCAACLFGGLTSCKTPQETVSAITMYYLGSQHQFTSAPGLYIYQSSNYSVLQATESSHSSNTFYLNYVGTNIATYTLSPSSQNAINMTLNGIVYSSQAFHGHGTVHITKLDAATMMATGDFNGTLYNTNTASDSVAVTQGSISVKYQLL